MASIFGSMVESLTMSTADDKRVQQSKGVPVKGLLLAVNSDFQSSSAVVMGAMLFPRNASFRASFCLRDRWASLAAKDTGHTLTSSDLRDLLSVASGHELSEASKIGTKQGTVAGDLLSLIYEHWRLDGDQPSMRKALSLYRQFAVDRKYGDGEALKRSDMQLRTYLEAAAPSAHLWAAHRLLKKIKDRGKSYKAAFTAEGMPLFLGVAKELQDFAITYIPKGTKPAKPIIGVQDMLLLPETIAPVKLPFRVL